MDCGSFIRPHDDCRLNGRNRRRTRSRRSGQWRIMRVGHSYRPANSREHRPGWKPAKNGLRNYVVDAAEINREHVCRASVAAALGVIECQAIRFVRIDGWGEMQVHKHAPLIGMLSIVVVGMGKRRRRNTGQQANRRTYRNQFTSHPESQALNRSGKSKNPPS